MLLAKMDTHPGVLLKIGFPDLQQQHHLEPGWSQFPQCHPALMKLRGEGAG